jgi:hypothetical protein
MHVPPPDVEALTGESAGLPGGLGDALLPRSSAAPAADCIRAR